MAIQILSNLNYPIGNIINQELQNAKSARIAVAFLRFSGLKVIQKSIEFCINNKGSVEIIAGLDFKNTDPQSIHYFIKLQKQSKSMNFYCYGDTKEHKTHIIFHPKMYLFSKERETTGIIGSTNLTAGGLLTNFEVNVVIKEKRPVYFSQLETIYNSMKFTDSIFSPDEEYLAGYSDVYKAFLKNEEKATKDISVRKIVDEIKKREAILPGTVPSIKSMIIEVIKQKQDEGLSIVPLQEIYKEVEGIVKKKKLSFKMDTFRNSIRGELNKHEKNSKHPDNMCLFNRLSKAGYSLTERGKKYEGR